MEAFKKQEAARKRNRLLGIIGAIVALVLVAGTVTTVIVLNAQGQQVPEEQLSGDYEERLQLFDDDPDLPCLELRDCGCKSTIGVWRNASGLICDENGVALTVGGRR